MKSILFVASVASHIRAFHLPFINQLRGRGHEVEIACHNNAPLDDVLPGCRVWEIPFPRSPYSPDVIRAYTKVKTLLAARNYDLIHVHTPVASFLVRAATRNRVSVLYTAHGFHFYRGAPWQGRWIYYHLEKLAMSWTRGLIVINGEDFWSAQRLGMIEGQNLFRVHGVGVDLEAYGHGLPGTDAALPASKEAAGFPATAKIVLCVAEFTPNKNHMQIIEAWPQVVKAVPDAYLVFAGKGEKEVQIRKEVLRRHLLPSIKFLGFRSDVPALLTMADVVVLSSRREGLPRVVMEAMASAKPVVATNIRGSRDLIRNGKNGYLVPVDDFQALAGALINLLSTPELARKMGQQGRKDIQPYALENVLAEMSQIYSQFLGES